VLRGVRSACDLIGEEAFWRTAAHPPSAAPSPIRPLDTVWLKGNESCGIPDASILTKQEEIAALRPKLHAKVGTLVAVLKIKPGDQSRTVPEREGTLIASRFMRSVTGGEQSRA
jgi:hypothetical protein